MNAAVWFGGSLFMMVGVAPAVFAADMDRLGDLWKGIIAFHLFERYFALQYWCGAVALAHLFTEWVYLGKPLYRLSLGLVVGVFCLSLAGGLIVQPRLKQLHAVKYGPSEPEPRKSAAARSLKIWHGISQSAGLLVVGGLGWYLWRMGNPPNAPRYAPSSKLRS
ncbi:MAG TPA: DUF4149 domain-containing protein [Verrucomicrobiae bacterium]|nr:DUF4149 domain-containing protein [Verrucomicrobiae bacterium]